MNWRIKGIEDWEKGKIIQMYLEHCGEREVQKDTETGPSLRGNDQEVREGVEEAWYRTASRAPRGVDDSERAEEALGGSEGH
jgi:hypothetical protein